MATPVRVYEIVTADGANLQNNEICNESAANATTGFNMWAGKDDSGNVTRWLALDENAQVADLNVTGDITVISGSITIDALSLSTAQANNVMYGDFAQSNSFKFEGGKLRVGSTVTPDYFVDIGDNASTGLRIYNTAADDSHPVQVFEKASASPADSDGIGKIIYRSLDGNQSAPAKVDLITIEATTKDVSAKTGEYKITYLREGQTETLLLDNNGLEISRGVITLKETTTPTAKQHHGKVYTKSDNALYFQDGKGTETVLGGVVSFRSYGYHSRPAASGEEFVAGHYFFSAADANLNQGSTTVTISGANTPHGSRAFIVSGGNGTTDGSDLVLTVSGTSMTDAGVRTTTDTEVIEATAEVSALNTYFETTKKWIGTITFTLSSTGGSTFSYDFNYGNVKYDDLGNRNFVVKNVEITGLANANDSGFNFQLLHHKTTGYTYSAAAFDPFNSTAILADMNSTYVTETDLDAGEPFAFKLTNLDESIVGSGSEGIIMKVTTSANNAVSYMNIWIGAELD